MISYKDLWNLPGRDIRVKLKNGMTSEGFCTEYQPPADEDESDNITIERDGFFYEINDYEIESIEILSAYKPPKPLI